MNNLLRQMMYGTRGVIDPVQAYFDAVEAESGFLSATFKSEYASLVADLKSAGWYNRLKAFYPYAGGNTGAAAINSISPGTFDWTFYGAWVHNDYGSQAPGVVGGRAQNGLIPTLELSLNSTSIGYYANLRPADGYDLTTATGDAVHRLAIGGFGTTAYTNANNPFDQSDSVITNLLGFNMVTRVNSSEYHFIQKTTIHTKPVASTQLSDDEFKLGSWKDLSLPSSTRFAAAYIGEGFTTTEALAFKTRLETFLTAIGRNI